MGTPRRWEDKRVISRCRVASSLAFLCIALTVTGCSDAWNFGPLQYVDSEALTQDLKGKANLAGKPALQDAVRKTLAKKFGEAPNRIRVPEGSGLVEGGLLLGNYLQEGEGPDAKLFPLYQADGVQAPTKVVAAEHTDLRRQAGGYARLPQELPALPRRFRRRRWTDGPVLVSSAAGLPARDLQVHVDAVHAAAAP